MPVALNLYKIRQDKSEAGDFWRSVQRQKPNYQGLWLVSPEGKVLAAHQDMSSMSDPRGKWARAALADLEAGLKAFGPVKPRRVEKFQPRRTGAWARSPMAASPWPSLTAGSS